MHRSALQATALPECARAVHGGLLFLWNTQYIIFKKDWTFYMHTKSDILFGWCNSGSCKEHHVLVLVLMFEARASVFLVFIVSLSDLSLSHFMWLLFFSTLTSSILSIHIRQEERLKSQVNPVNHLRLTGSLLWIIYWCSTAVKITHAIQCEVISLS